MIDHDRYRRTLLADPHCDNEEILAHCAGCASCNAFTQRLLAFEETLRRAIKEDVTPNADILPLKPRSTHQAAGRSGRTRWLALAASVTIALVVTGIAWLAAPQQSLAADVVAHMAGEPNAWNTRVPLPAGELDAILKRAHMRLDPNAPTVSYANPCIFRGHMVPHLVVQSADGPVTVMVLTHESVLAPTHFDEQGYRGTILPIPGHGSLAVLMKTPTSTMAELDATAAQVRSAIVWKP